VRALVGSIIVFSVLNSFARGRFGNAATIIEFHGSVKILRRVSSPPRVNRKERKERNVAGIPSSHAQSAAPGRTGRASGHQGRRVGVLSTGVVFVSLALGGSIWRVIDNKKCFCHRGS